MMNSFRPWRTPVLLLILASVSILFGALQMTLLYQGDSHNDMAEAHYFNDPVPIVIHIVSGSLFNLLLPWQFAPTLRKRLPRLHRYSGRLMFVCGFAFALSGLWMNESYPPYGGTAKYLGIWVHSVLLMVGLSLAVVAIRRRQSATHRVWMLRACAVALSPATQRVFVIPAVLVFGEEFMSDALIGALIWFGLILNLGVVEWILFRERQKAVYRFA